MTAARQTQQDGDQNSYQHEDVANMLRDLTDEAVPASLSRGVQLRIAREERAARTWQAPWLFLLPFLEIACLVFLRNGSRTTTAWLITTAVTAQRMLWDPAFGAVSYLAARLGTATHAAAESIAHLDSGVGLVLAAVACVVAAGVALTMEKADA